MRYRTQTLLPVAVGLLVGIASAITSSNADIKNQEAGGEAKASGEPGYEALGPEAPLRVRCWQEGREIIDERNLHSMNLKPLLEQASVSFKTKGGGGLAVHIIAVEKTTCLVDSDD